MMQKMSAIFFFWRAKGEFNKDRDLETSFNLQDHNLMSELFENFEVVANFKKNSNFSKLF